MKPIKKHSQNKRSYNPLHYRKNRKVSSKKSVNNSLKWGTCLFEKNKKVKQRRKYHQK